MSYSSSQRGLLSVFRRTTRFALAVALVGCDALRGAEPVCTADLRATVSPADTSIAVGQSFPAQLILKGCSGTKLLHDSYRYSSEDSTVARVDNTGIVTGRQPGATIVDVQALGYGVAAKIPVTVHN